MGSCNADKMTGLSKLDELESNMERNMRSINDLKSQSDPAELGSSPTTFEESLNIFHSLYDQLSPNSNYHHPISFDYSDNPLPGKGKVDNIPEYVNNTEPLDERNRNNKGIYEDLDGESISKLRSALGNNIIAQEIAIAHIKEKMKRDPTFTVTDYVAEYNNEDRTIEPILRVLTLALKSAGIPNTCNNSCTILNILSFLSHTGIETKSLEKLCNHLNPKDNFLPYSEEIELIEKYGIIKLQEGKNHETIIVIEPETQDVIRKHVRNQNKEVMILSKLLDYFRETSLEFISTIHVWCVWLYTTAYYKLVEEFKQVAIMTWMKLDIGRRLQFHKQFYDQFKHCIVDFDELSLKMERTFNYINFALMSADRMKFISKNGAHIDNQSAKCTIPTEVANYYDELNSIQKLDIDLWERVIADQNSSLLRILFFSRSIGQSLFKEQNFTHARKVLEDGLKLQKHKGHCDAIVLSPEGAEIDLISYYLDKILKEQHRQGGASTNTPITREIMFEVVKVLIAEYYLINNWKQFYDCLNLDVDNRVRLEKQSKMEFKAYDIFTDILQLWKGVNGSAATIEELSRKLSEEGFSQVSESLQDALTKGIFTYVPPKKTKPSHNSRSYSQVVFGDDCDRRNIG